jgi:hypothetical protein
MLEEVDIISLGLIDVFKTLLLGAVLIFQMYNENFKLEADCKFFHAFDNIFVVNLLH